MSDPQSYAPPQLPWPSLPWPVPAPQTDRLASPSLAGKLARMRRTQRIFDHVAALSPRLDRRPLPAAPTRIGVLLLWGIGDAILAQPLLAGLKRRWPDAQIEAIGRGFLPALFGPADGVDACRTLAAPWIYATNKYKLWTPPWRALLGQIRQARQLGYDLLLNPRMDPRDQTVMRAIGAGQLAGHMAAGGKSWLDIDFALAPTLYEWLPRGRLAALCGEAVAGVPFAPTPRLRVDPARAAEARRQIAAAGPRPGPIVGVCFGGTHPLRRWDAQKIGAALAAVAEQIGLLVLIEDGGGQTISPPLPEGVPSLTWRGPLDALKGVSSQLDLLFCSDSGIMHLAAACGTPTVAIFGPTSLDSFRPHGPGHRIVALEPMPCRTCWDSCIQPRPYCLDDLPATHAAAALTAALHDIGARRIDGPLPAAFDVSTLGGS